MPETGNKSRLRGLIDTGKTSDKVPFPDPAAAPLGTDEEAAGTPLTRRAVESAMASETHRSASHASPDASGPWTWVLVLVGVLVVIAAAAALFWPAAP